MTRLFVAITPPDEFAEHLTPLQGGLAGAAWRPPEAFHLTLRFVGEADRRLADDIAAALSGVSAPAFDLALAGCGSFGSKRPRAVWAGAERNASLLLLQSKVDMAVQRAGVAPEGRKYTPHVTLAYLDHAQRDEVAAYVAARAAFRSPSFSVCEFHLMSSTPGSEGAAYEVEASFPLERAR